MPFVRKTRYDELLLKESLLKELGDIGTILKKQLDPINNNIGLILSKLDEEQPEPDPIEPDPIEPDPDPIDPDPIPVISEYYRADQQLTAFIASNPTHKDIATLKQIDAIPQAVWLTGSTNDQPRVRKILQDAKGRIPLFVIYAIPDRDAGNHSAGGFATVEEYNAWIGAIGWEVQNAGNPRVDFVIEPDALGLLNDRPTTYPCINAAVDILKKNSNTKVFLEGAMWVAPVTADFKALSFEERKYMPRTEIFEPLAMADNLIGAGIKRSDGLCLNVSGHTPFVECVTYAEKVLNKIGQSNLQYMIDTSRNGGTTAAGDWCNPNGAKVGEMPKIINKGQFYGIGWVKVISESDGNCNGSPVGAGGLWPERAVSLFIK